MNEYYQQDRQRLGVNKNDLSLDNIVPVTNDTICNEIEAHKLTSNKYSEKTKNQRKVYFKNEKIGRYFFVAYTELAQPGWSTGVCVLDENYNKLGGFGV